MPPIIVLPDQSLEKLGPLYVIRIGTASQLGRFRNIHTAHLSLQVDIERDQEA
jgi:hypothetical protein